MALIYWGCTQHSIIHACKLSFRQNQAALLPGDADKIRPLINMSACILASTASAAKIIAANQDLTCTRPQSPPASCKGCHGLGGLSMVNTSSYMTASKLAYMPDSKTLMPSQCLSGRPPCIDSLAWLTALSKGMHSDACPSRGTVLGLLQGASLKFTARSIM